VKSRVWLGKIALVWLLLGCVGLLAGQVPAAPGQVAAAPRLAAPSHDDVAAANGSSAVPQTTIANVEDPHDRLMERLWIASIAADLAATSLDAATSWGKREGNSLLASSDGTFGGKGVAIKAGFAAAVLIPQICFRKHKDMRGIFVMGNFGQAGIFAGTAVHNLQIRSAATVH